MAELHHHSPVSGVATWKDTYVATAGYDNQVILWDLATDRPLSLGYHDHLVNQCRFSNNGQHLVTASSDYSARVWSVPELRLEAVLKDHQDDVEMVAPHPTEALIATASRDHAVRVFDFGGTLLHTFLGHTADVISVEWAEDGDELVSSSDDGTIKRWSLSQGRMIGDIDMNGVETDTVALDANGTIYAGNDEGELIAVRDSGRVVVQAHDAGIKRVVLDGDNGRLVTLSYDRKAVIWDVRAETPVEVTSFPLPDEVWPRSCAFIDTDSLVFATFGDRYRRYQISDGTWGHAPDTTKGLNAVAASSGVGGTDLVVGDAGVVKNRSRNGEFRTAQRDLGSLCNFLTPVPGAVLTGGQLGRIYDAISGTLIYQHRSPLNCAVNIKHAGNDAAVVGTYTGEGLLLERIDGRWQFVREIGLLANAIKGIAASDTTVFAVGADCSATWWDIATLTEIRTVHQAHGKIANGCVWVAEESFASVSRDLKLRIWDSSGRAVVIDTPHSHSIKCTAAITDAKSGRTFVATASYDGTAAIYDVAANRWTLSRRLTTSGISSLAADGVAGLFLASSYDGNVYEIPTGEMDPQKLAQRGTTTREPVAAW